MAFLVLDWNSFLGLSIICSAVKWLKDHRNRAQLGTQEPKVDKENDGELDWLGVLISELNFSVMKYIICCI